MVKPHPPDSWEKSGEWARDKAHRAVSLAYSPTLCQAEKKPQTLKTLKPRASRSAAEAEKRAIRERSRGWMWRDHPLPPSLFPHLPRHPETASSINSSDSFPHTGPQRELEHEREKRVGNFLPLLATSRVSSKITSPIALILLNEEL